MFGTVLSSNNEGFVIRYIALTHFPLREVAEMTALKVYYTLHKLQLYPLI